MLPKLRHVTKHLLNTLSLGKSVLQSPETTPMLLGTMLSRLQQDRMTIDALSDVEFKVFSQCGDDGIIQWLIKRLPIAHPTFIEFGVANYRESNTRFLLMHDNWQGFVMDGSDKNVRQITNSEYYWKYDLRAKGVFIDAENVNGLIKKSGFTTDLGILHIDLDGNDYWIWKAIDCYQPRIAIMEYNAVFDAVGPISVPYDAHFIRSTAHYSHLYWGASLSAFTHLANEKGYALVGCNGAGINAYFVRRDLLNDAVREIPYEQAFVASRFRDSRDRAGNLTFLREGSRLEVMRGMPAIDVTTGNTVTI